LSEIRCNFLLSHSEEPEVIDFMCMHTACVAQQWRVWLCPAPAHLTCIWPRAMAN